MENIFIGKERKENKEVKIKILKLQNWENGIFGNVEENYLRS